MRDQTVIPLAERAATVADYLQSIGEPRVTVVSFEGYTPGGITVQLDKRVPEVPWVIPDEGDLGRHPHVFVEYSGIRMRVVTIDRSGLDTDAGAHSTHRKDR